MNLAEISVRLAQCGYIILDNPMEDSLLKQLLARCNDDDPSRFHSAHIGRGADKQQIKSMRGDVINWLEADNSPADRAYLEWMETLRAGVNSNLFLGLFDYECHYAIYRAGSGYVKHSDVLRGKRNRILTTVLYLNENWQPSDGGELLIYDPTGETVLETVTPTFGKLVIFLSEMFPHEVLLSHSTRRSIAGWFRANGS